MGQSLPRPGTYRPRVPTLWQEGTSLLKVSDLETLSQRRGRSQVLVHINTVAGRSHRFLPNSFLVAVDPLRNRYTSISTVSLVLAVQLTDRRQEAPTARKGSTHTRSTTTTTTPSQPW